MPDPSTPPKSSRLKFAQDWLRAALKPTPPRARIACIRQGWGDLRFGASVDGTPLRLQGRSYAHGLGTHADSEIAITLDAPARRLRAVVGVDDNENSVSPLQAGAQLCRLVFSVETEQGRIWESPPLTVSDAPVLLDLELPNASTFHLLVEAVDGYNHFGHADWADAQVELADGSAIWLGDTLDRQRLPQRPVVSFLYDGKPSPHFFQRAEVHEDTEALEGGVTRHRQTYSDPETGLTCILELDQFPDFPALEYVLRFRNDGQADTPLLEDIQVLDVAWMTPSTARLHRSRGSRGHIDDFAYQCDEIPRSSEFPMIAGDGRSSTNWLPYFSLQTGDQGLIWAIGWSGQWAASVTRSADDAISLRAGLERTHLVLHPGEEIRMPRIALLFWEGAAVDAANQWRRFALAHHAPHRDESEGPLSAGAWGGVKTQTHLETIAMLQKHRMPYDVYWIDAGWYGTPESYSPLESTGKWYGQAGNWEPNPIGHPDGLGSIGDAAHQAGMRFLLWFELERAVWGSSLTQQHPDWFLGEKTSGRNVLLDLGNPEARSWMIEYLSHRITEWNIDWYRQDFNFEPLPYWRDADAPDRQGMAEIGHIQGLYAVWDELLRRHPHLKIDNCASGGQRLDLELVTRSVALWRSDYQCLSTFDPLGAQIQTGGLSPWVPLSGSSVHIRPEDTYNFRSALSAALSFPVPAPVDGEEPEYPWEWHRAMLDQYLRARPFYSGDYYPLTRFSTGQETWFAYQMHRQDLDAGMIVAFRREECPYLGAQFSLFGLDTSRRYQFEDADTGQTRIDSGENVMMHPARTRISSTSAFSQTHAQSSPSNLARAYRMEPLDEKGLSLTLAQPRQSALIFYTAVAD